QPGRYQQSQFAQKGTGYVAGDSDADHADDDLGIGSADIGVPDEEAKAAARGAAGRARAAAAGNHFRGHDHGPSNANSDRGSDHDRRYGAGENDAAKDVPAR